MYVSALTDGIASERPEQAGLGDGLESGPANHRIAAVADVVGHAEVDGVLVRPSHQVGIVGLGHRRKARSPALVVLAFQRTVARQTRHVDVVLDDHDVADGVFGVQAARRVRHDQRLHAQQLHHAHRHRTLPHRVALVRVEAALHAHHRHLVQVAKDQRAAMSHHCKKTML